LSRCGKRGYSTHEGLPRPETLLVFFPPRGECVCSPPSFNNRTTVMVAGGRVRSLPSVFNNLILPFPGLSPPRDLSRAVVPRSRLSPSVSSSANSAILGVGMAFLFSHVEIQEPPSGPVPWEVLHYSFLSPTHLSLPVFFSVGGRGLQSSSGVPLSHVSSTSVDGLPSLSCALNFSSYSLLPVLQTGSVSILSVARFTMRGISFSMSLEGERGLFP